MHQGENYGALLNLTKVMVRRPCIVKAAIGLYVACEKSGLARICGAAFACLRAGCFDQRLSVLSRHQLSVRAKQMAGATKVVALENWRESKFLTRWNAWRLKMQST